MKLMKFFMSFLLLFLSTVSVSAESSGIMVPNAYVFIWPTHYRIYLDETIRVYYEIVYQEVWLSATSQYATDSCEGVYNYTQPPFVPVPIKKILPLSQASFDDYLSNLSMDNLLSTDWACTVRYQNTVRLGEIVYTIPIW
ncbi:MAG: hypothetical protein FD133_1652 [Erysipelotrichaceae bacterium]|nr:MAG: hypothetical protein FD179_1803 [Erysipelotrichaceae bacterium]TXT16834.1 MAG: hypothetical protein FD133_1652 [Erysipelotrichaceae bacterium]